MPKSAFSFAFLATLAIFFVASLADKHSTDFVDFNDVFSADLEGRGFGGDLDAGYSLPPPYDYGTPVVTSTVTSSADEHISSDGQFTTTASVAVTSSALATTTSASNATVTLTVIQSWSTTVSSGTSSNKTKTITLTDVLPPVQTSVGTISVHASVNHTHSVHWTNSTTSVEATSVSSAIGTAATVTTTYTVYPTGFSVSSLVRTLSTSTRADNETVTVTLWPTHTPSHDSTTVSTNATSATSSASIQSARFSITADSSSWFKSSVLGTAISSSGSVSPSQPGLTLTTTVTHYGTTDASSSVGVTSTSESVSYSIMSSQDAKATTSIHEVTTITEQSSGEATPVVFTSTQFVTVTQYPSISVISDNSSSLATPSTATEQVSAQTTTATSSDYSISSDDSTVYTVTATGATVTVTVTNTGKLPNVTTTAIPPYPTGNSTCSHTASGSGAYTRPTGTEMMCITITGSSTVARECFTVLPIVSSVTGTVIAPSQSARNATVPSTSSFHNNTATVAPTTFTTSVSSSPSDSVSSEESIPTHIPPSPNFPWGGDSPAHRHQNEATLGGGLRVRRFFNRL